MKHHYTHEDVGCWIDGAFGEKHAVDKIQLMLPDTLLGWEGWDYEEEPEFSLDYLADATDALYQHTEDGLIWIWEAGDLILTTEDQLD